MITNARNLYNVSRSPRSVNPKMHGITKLAELHALTSIYASLFTAKVQANVKSAITAPDIPQSKTSIGAIASDLPPSTVRTITKAIIVHNTFLTPLKKVFCFGVAISELTNLEQAPFAAFDTTERIANKYPILYL